MNAWVQFWVNQYAWSIKYRRDIDQDDLRQAIRIGIWQAERGYDPSKGSWANYSSYFIKHEIKRLLGRPGPCVASLDEELPGSDGMTLHDVLPDDSLPGSDDGLLLEEQQRTIHDAVDRLPDRERLLVELRYFQSKSQRETAEILGVKEQRVHSIFENARRRLRRDRALRDLAGLSYSKWGLEKFRSTGMSVVEMAVIERERGWTNEY